MEKLQIRLGCWNYDRTRALLDGTVQAEGIDLSCAVMNPHELFYRVLTQGEFDAAEMSLSNLMTVIGRGNREMIAIPVFLSRVFRHGFVFVNVDSGIGNPQDLIGKRVGVPEYSMTAAVWVRAFLQHDYGVLPGQMKWFSGSLNVPSSRGGRISVHPGLDIQPIGPDKSLGGMLESGELDAVITAAVPRVFISGSPRVRRLFPNYQQVEAEYYARTGIVPIMHTVMIRSSIYEQSPWVARGLYDAFVRAKQECYKQLEEAGAPSCSLTWLGAYVEAERALFGVDHWPYGIEANRKSIEALAAYVYEQGLSDRLVSIESIFAPETISMD